MNVFRFALLAQDLPLLADGFHRSVRQSDIRSRQFVASTHFRSLEHLSFAPAAHAAE